MYQRILLAYDGSVEGRLALREGALMAYRCGAQVYLLSVATGLTSFRLAEGAHGGALTHHREQLTRILDDGAAKLAQLGLRPISKLVIGEPAEEIRNYAKEIDADLVVVGHRRQSLFDRWWSGANGAYLSDQIRCSLLIARNTINDQTFEAELDRAKRSSASA